MELYILKLTSRLSQSLSAFFFPKALNDTSTMLNRVGAVIHMTCTAIFILMTISIFVEILKGNGGTAIALSGFIIPNLLIGRAIAFILKP